MIIGVIAYSLIGLGNDLLWLALVPLIIILAFELNSFHTSISVGAVVDFLSGPLLFLVTVFILKEPLIKTSYLMTVGRILFFYESLALLSLFQRPNKNDLLPVILSLGLVTCVFFGLSLQHGFFSFSGNSGIEYALKFSSLGSLLVRFGYVLRTRQLPAFVNEDIQLGKAAAWLLPASVVFVVVFQLFVTWNLTKHAPEWLMGL